MVNLMKKYTWNNLKGQRKMAGKTGYVSSTRACTAYAKPVTSGPRNSMIASQRTDSHSVPLNTVFTPAQTRPAVILAVHVDNMPITASSPKAMASAKNALRKYFEIVDLGPVKWSLGICIECDRNTCTISLSQTAYIDTIDACFKLEDAFKVKIPMNTDALLSKQLAQPQTK